MAFISHRVRDKKNGDAPVAELVHFAHAALPGIDITHGERLIDKQDFGVDVDGDGKSQANQHAARVCFYRLINKAANFGKCGNTVVSRVYFASSQAENRRIQVHIFTPREFGIESGPQLEKCGNAAANIGAAC